MTALLTQCPHCQTSFRVTTAQLNAANSLVRCGSCLGVFSATANEIRIKHPDGYVVEEIETFENEPDEPVIPESDEDIAPAIEIAYEPAAYEPAAYEPAAYEPVANEAEALEAVVYEAAAHELPAPETPAEYRSNASAFDEFEPSLGDLSLDEFDHQILDQDDPLPDIDEVDTGLEPASDRVESVAATETEILQEQVPRPLREQEPLAIPAAKRQVHSSLSTLDFDDALAPVTGEELDALDDEPVTLGYGTGLRARIVTGLLLAAAALLLLALPLPWLYAHRNELATHPRFSFMAEPVCRFVTCEAPALPSSTAAMYTQQLLVRSDPRADNALEVSFVFHNDAAQAQPFPGLELAFSDINNKLLANRLFTPQEYLPAELRQLGTMPAQSSVQVQLELADPGSEAVNYKVVLHAQ